MSSNYSHNDSNLQRDSLDRGGQADLRKFDAGTVLPSQTSSSLQSHPVRPEERIGSVVSGSAQNNTMGPTAHVDNYLQRDSLDRGGTADLRKFDSSAGSYMPLEGMGMQSGTHSKMQSSILPGMQSGIQPGMQSGMQSGGHMASAQGLYQPPGQSLDAPGSTLGERLKNAVVQTVQEAQTGTIGNDVPPGHFEHNTAHVKLAKTYGATSNPPDLLRDEDLESRERDQNRKRSNFELSEAGRVDIVPTDSPHTDMGTTRMGIPAKESYGGGVGYPHGNVETHSSSGWSDNDPTHMRSGSEWNKAHMASDPNAEHWTVKAADAIEDTKSKISETTHAAVNLAKSKLSHGHSEGVPQK